MNFIGQYQAKETSFCDALIEYFDDIQKNYIFVSMYTMIFYVKTI